ncbi:MAG: hypothetical protein JW864_04260 [Spirochaetes bacterium]|nr:hypothetical protein [Spirochaetota bacterium]
MKKIIIILISILFLHTESYYRSILFAKISDTNENIQSENKLSESEKKDLNQNTELQLKSDETTQTKKNIEPLRAPEIIATKGILNDRIEIKWNNIPEADKYFIYKSITNNKEDFTELSQTQSFSFTDTNVEPGKVYNYKIKAWSEKRNFSEFSNTDTGYLKLLSPQIKVSALSTATVEISWQQVPGAQLYYIYRSDSETEEFTEIGKTEKLSFNDNSAVPGKIYHYKAASWTETIGYSDYSTSEQGIKKLKTPQISLSGSQFEKITITWNSIEGAEKYIIYASESQSGQFIEIISVTATSYETTSKNEISYKVRAFANNTYSEFSNISSTSGTKSYTGLYLRGIVPGLGQYYRGDKENAMLYGGGFAISALLLIGSIQLQRYTWNQYDSLEYGSSESDFDNKYNAYKFATYSVWFTAGLTIAAYALNWLDILYFNKSSTPKSAISNTKHNKTGNYNFTFDINNDPKSGKTIYAAYNLRF